MSVPFAVASWAAWAPGLADRSRWLEWLSAPGPVSGADSPPLEAMPPMMRRRIERAGRMALQVAYDVLDVTHPGPYVFASRYGDMKRTIELLRQIAAGEPMSPMSFSVSVHNSVGAYFSIARQDPAAYTAIAAGEETAEAAFVEALGLLASGESAATVVYFDDPLPEPYAALVPVPRYGDMSRAWACRLVRDPAGLILQPGPILSAARDEEAELPPDLEVLRFVLCGQSQVTRCAGRRTWQWSRADARRSREAAHA